jgi:hypothetical protein
MKTNIRICVSMFVSENYMDTFHLTTYSLPTTSLQPDQSPTEQDDRTPGRLQAVWPPPKTKDTEEKVGLKYTEAGNVKGSQAPRNQSLPEVAFSCGSADSQNLGFCFI